MWRAPPTIISFRYNHLKGIKAKLMVLPIETVLEQMRSMCFIVFL